MARPTPHIKITVDGKDQLDRYFSRLDANFDDLSPIGPAIRDHFWEIQGEQFASEGSKGRSGKWQDLSTRYASQKEAKYGPGLKILERTGLLKGSLTGPNAGSYYTASKNEIVVGTTVPYGIYHQRGDGKLPKREPISLSDANQRSMGRIIHGALIRELRTGRYYVPVSDRSF